MEYNQNKKSYNNSFYNDPIPSNYKGGSSDYNNQNVKQHSPDESYSSSYQNRPYSSAGNSSSYQNKPYSSAGSSNSYQNKPYSSANNFNYNSSNNIPNRFQNYQDKYARKATKISLLERISNSLKKRKGEPNPDSYLTLPAFFWSFIGMFAGLLIGGNIFDYSAFVKVNVVFFILQYLLIAVFIFVPAFSVTDNVLKTVGQVIHVSFCSLFLLMGNWGYLSIINCRFDFHKPTVNYVKIDRKHYYTTRGSKGSTHHHYKIYFTDDTGGTECVDGGSSVFNRAYEGAIQNFTTNSGLLGVKHWVSSKSFTESYNVTDFPDGTRFPISKEKCDQLRMEKKNRSYDD